MDLPSGEWFFTFADAIVTTKQKFSGHKGSSELYRDKKIYFCEDIWVPNYTAKIIAVYSDFLIENLDRLSLFKNATTFLTHNSDEILNEEKVCKWLDSNPQIKLYAQNLTFFHPRAFVLPIGQANSMWPHGNKIPWKNIKFNKDIKILKTYCENTHNSRVNLFSVNHPKIANAPKLDYNNYVTALSRSQFVLCPSGNGPDTHRFWETLGAKSIPIVLSSPFIDQVKRCFPTLPMIITNDYNNVDYDSVVYNFPENIEPIDKNYWSKVFPMENKMKLGCVLTAVNENPLYTEFIPIFIKAWKKLLPNVDVKIVLIANSIPDDYIEFSENIILFPPIDGVSTSLTSQYIRSLYPAILPCEDGVLITDMDMLPMNGDYYTKSIQNIDNDRFIYLRDVLLRDGQIAMCYNVATPKVWGEIFNIKTIDDIKERLKSVASRTTYTGVPGESGWFSDQIDLYKSVMDWNRKTGKFTYLNDSYTNFGRLDRIHNINIDDSLRAKIKQGIFSDYHAMRPYSKYKEINDAIIDSL